MTSVEPSPRHRVLIVEQNPTGHRLFYVRILAQAALGRGDEVTLLLGAEPDHDAEQVHLGQVPPIVQRMRRPRVSLDELAALSVELQSDQVVVPDGDRLALRLALRARWAGRGDLSVLIMRETAHSQAWRVIGRAKSWVRSAAFRRVNAMGNVHLCLLKSSTWRGYSRMAVAVDPVVLNGDARAVSTFRAAHDLSEERYWFAVLGAISARKNLEIVLDALARSTGPIGLLVAGQMDDSISRELRSKLDHLAKNGRAVVLNRLLSDEELDAAVASADCVVLAHSNEGPSGLLGKAAAVGTRVVCAGAQSLRRDVEDFPSLGEWVPLQLEALAAAFDRAAGRPRPPAVLHATSAAFTSALLR